MRPNPLIPVNQSEIISIIMFLPIRDQQISIVLSQPIRNQFYKVSTNQRPVLFSIVKCLPIFPAAGMMKMILICCLIQTPQLTEECLVLCLTFRLDPHVRLSQTVAASEHTFSSRAASGSVLLVVIFTYLVSDMSQILYHLQNKEIFYFLTIKFYLLFIFNLLPKKAVLYFTRIEIYFYQIRDIQQQGDCSK